MNRIVTTPIVILVATVTLLTSCARAEADVVSGGPGAGRGGTGGGRGAAVARSGAGAGESAMDIASLVADLPMSELSEAEAAGLVYMREEEKLARDVYSALYEAWNLPIFTSIARSEAEHMDAVRSMLDRYGIPDPVVDDTRGVFTDPELAALYTELVSRGSASLADALAVGATIEDLDIADLQQEVALSDNDDLRIVYQNLMKGSRNHIRSFIAQLERLDETYEARYITDEYLAEILRVSREVAPITDPQYEL